MTLIQMKFRSTSEVLLEVVVLKEIREPKEHKALRVIKEIREHREILVVVDSMV